MPLAHLLATMLAVGLLLFEAGICLALLQRARTRRRAVVARFSGSVVHRGSGRAPPDHVALRRTGPSVWWARLLPEAGESAAAPDLTPDMRRLIWMLMLALTLFLTMVLNVLIGAALLPALALGLLCTLLAGYVWLRLRARRRLFRIDEAVPEAMDMIVRALRVGLPINAAIKTAGEELTGPLAQEFTETATRISYGQDPVGAIREMAERCDNQSLRFFAAAVSIQSASGGNLAEVLDRLCAIARGRQQMRRKVRSITAEAKWSGRFLSFFPFLSISALLLINPDYFAEISDKPFFLPMLGVVGTLLALNILFMRWLVKIE